MVHVLGSDYSLFGQPNLVSPGSFHSKVDEFSPHSVCQLENNRSTRVRKNEYLDANDANRRLVHGHDHVSLVQSGT